MATVVAIGRMRTRFGADWDTDMSTLPAFGIEGSTLLQFGASVAWGNFASIVIFALLVGTALIKRKQPVWHKRLMLLASLAILAPALARISRLPGLGGEDGLFIPMVFLLLLLSVAVHDFRTLRKPHPASMIGLASILAAGLATPIAVGTEVWLDFIRSMG